MHSLFFLQAAGSDGNGVLLLMLGTFAIFFLVVMLPQKRQEKKMRESLQKGDEVVLRSGLLGKVHAVGERDLVLQLEEGRARVLKDQVQQVLKPAGGDAGKRKNGKNGKGEAGASRADGPKSPKKD